MTVWGYVRAGGDHRRTREQKLVIMEYVRQKRLVVDRWIDVRARSRGSLKEKGTGGLLAQVKKGDIIIVSELTRLGRSIGQVAILVDELMKNDVKVICLKENMTLHNKVRGDAKVVFDVFLLFAKIERSLISERTKEGLAKARLKGRLLGRPKGAIGKSKLDGKEEEIKRYLLKGVNRTNVARIYGVSFPTLQNFIKTRGLLS